MTTRPTPVSTASSDVNTSPGVCRCDVVFVFYLVVSEGAAGVRMETQPERFYKHDLDPAATYVTGDLTGPLCSLTKAFLFRSIGGERPEPHSWRMSDCPSAGEEVNKAQRPCWRSCPWIHHHLKASLPLPLSEKKYINTKWLPKNTKMYRCVVGQSFMVKTSRK